MGPTRRGRAALTFTNLPASAHSVSDSCSARHDDSSYLFFTRQLQIS